MGDRAEGSTQSPALLIDDYRWGDFLLATPRRTLLARGARVTVSERDAVALSDGVAKALAESGAPVAVGALPFDTSAPAHVVAPASVRWGPPASRATTPEPPSRPGPTGYRMRPVPEPAAYERAVARAVTELASGRLRKVVLARTLELALDEALDVRPLLRLLAGDNPDGYTFAAPLPNGRALVGATPELLVSRTGTGFACNPLAGSVPRDADPVRDRERAEGLLSSAKDHEEHRIVVDAVVAALRPYARRLTVPDRPSLVRTPSVWHLSTVITGELIDVDVTALTLAGALHPTPAVCGTPTEAAWRAIAEIEPFDRGFYGGAVGWCDAAGDGEWLVALRCAEVAERELRLFAGAGIVAASVPALELAETAAKFTTLLRAVGLTLDE